MLADLTEEQLVELARAAHVDAVRPATPHVATRLDSRCKCCGQQARRRRTKGRCDVSGPTVLETIGEWRIERWDYPGAPLQAESKGGVSVDVEDDDVCIEWRERCDDGYGSTTRSARVPVAVLRRLLGDRKDGAQ